MTPKQNLVQKFFEVYTDLLFNLFFLKLSEKIGENKIRELIESAFKIDFDFGKIKTTEELNDKIIAFINNLKETALPYENQIREAFEEARNEVDMEIKKFIEENS